MTTPTEQSMREKLKAAWLTSHPYPEIGNAIDRFERLLDAEAWLDAAMILWPKTEKLRQMNFSGPCADDRKWHLNIHGGKEGELHLVGRGTTPAEALLAAIEKARTM